MQFDVAIVGAGLVGQAIAAALSQGANDIRVALVDPSEPLPAGEGSGVNDYDLRVSALTAQSQAFLTDIGAWDLIPHQMLSGYTRMHVWDAEGTGSVTFNATDLHVPALGHIVENRQTLTALNKITESARSIERLQTAVQSFDNPDADGWVP